MSAEDFEGIRKATALYGHVIDNRTWDRLGEVYAAEGAYVNPRMAKAPFQGLAAIVEFLSTTPQPVVHMFTNHHIELNPDGRTATGWAKYLAIRPDTTLVAGDYMDIYVRTEAGWRIQRRESTVRIDERTAR